MREPQASGGLLLEGPNGFGFYLYCVYCSAGGFIDSRGRVHYDCLCEIRCADCGGRSHPDLDCPPAPGHP